MSAAKGLHGFERRASALVGQCVAAAFDVSVCILSMTNPISLSLMYGVSHCSTNCTRVQCTWYSWYSVLGIAGTQQPRGGGGAAATAAWCRALYIYFASKPSHLSTCVDQST